MTIQSVSDLLSSKPDCVIIQSSKIYKNRYINFAIKAKDAGVKDIRFLIDSTYAYLDEGYYDFLEDYPAETEWNTPKENSNVIILTDFAGFGHNGAVSWAANGQLFEEEGIRPVVITQVPTSMIIKRYNKYFDIFIMDDEKIVAIEEFETDLQTESKMTELMIAAIAPMIRGEPKELSSIRKMFQKRGIVIPSPVEISVLKNKDVFNDSGDFFLEANKPHYYEKYRELSPEIQLELLELYQKEDHLTDLNFETILRWSSIVPEEVSSQRTQLIENSLQELLDAGKDISSNNLIRGYFARLKKRNKDNNVFWEMYPQINELCEATAH